MHVFCGWALMVAAAALLVVATASCRPHAAGAAGQSGGLAASKVLGVDHVLYKVRDVALDGSTVAVLTGSEPTVHVFSDSRALAWGDLGEGPDEFRNPLSLSLDQDHLAVLDLVPGATRVATYSLTDRSLSSRYLEDYSFVYRFEPAAGQTYLEVGEWKGRERSVVRFDTTSPETLVVFPRAEKVKIRADEGPMNSYSIYLPFAPRPRWSSRAGGGIAFWDGRDDRVQWIDEHGQVVSYRDLPVESLAIEPEDLEAWFERELPSDAELFGHKDPFRGVRKRARKVLEFPSHFPAVLALEADPDGGTWVLRAWSARGQVWTLLDESGGSHTVRFPAGREVLAFGRDYIAAKVVDEVGIETVELFTRGDVAKERKFS